jgi:hypothetical protein
MLSVDPLYVGAVGHPQRWNRYAHVLNSPLNMVDPDGRQTFSTQTVENCGGTCFPKEETPQTQTYLNHNAYDPHLFLFYQYGDWSYQGDGGGINMSEWNQPTGAQVIEAVHLALDVAGMLPVVGDGADVINAAIYLAEGNVANAGMALAAAVPVAGAAVTAGKWANKAANAADALRLQKQLASTEQLGELAAGRGRVIAGSGSSTPIRTVGRLVEQYGGSANDWAKVSSVNKLAGDGSRFEIHAYRNVVTGQVVEQKTKLNP